MLSCFAEPVCFGIATGMDCFGSFAKKFRANLVRKYLHDFLDSEKSAACVILVDNDKLNEMYLAGMEPCDDGMLLAMKKRKLVGAVKKEEETGFGMGFVNASGMEARGCGAGPAGMECNSKMRKALCETCGQRMMMGEGSYLHGDVNVGIDKEITELEAEKTRLDLCTGGLGMVNDGGFEDYYDLCPTVFTCETASGMGKESSDGMALGATADFGWIKSCENVVLENTNSRGFGDGYNVFGVPYENLDSSGSSPFCEMTNRITVIERKESGKSSDESIVTECSNLLAEVMEQLEQVSLNIQRRVARVEAGGTSQEDVCVEAEGLESVQAAGMEAAAVTESPAAAAAADVHENIEI